MKMYKFADDYTNLPVTMKQFEDLTNEILTAVNELCAPHFLSSDYMAQILMSAIHALDHKHGFVNKSDLYLSCVNRISCHVTYHAVEEIKKKLDATVVTDPEIDNPEPVTLKVATEQTTEATTH